MSQHKKCKQCLKILPTTEYYKAGKSFQSRCKPCHNSHRLTYNGNKRIRPYKQTIINNLTKEQKDIINEYFKNKTSLKELAQKLNVNYSTVRVWSCKNMIPLKN